MDLKTLIRIKTLSRNKKDRKDGTEVTPEPKPADQEQDQEQEVGS